MLPTTGHRYHIVALWGLVLTLVLTCSSRSALAQAESPLFAYGVYGDYTIEIREFDPFVVGSETTVGTIPLAQNERLEDIFVAQHGQHLVALLTDGDNITLRQANLSSGEVSSVILQDAGFSLLRDLDPTIPLKTIAALSPDTRYLAVHIYRLNREQGVLIYDTVNQTMAVNTEANHYISTIAWANTNAELAATESVCDRDGCESQLNFFRPDNAAIEESIVVSPVIDFGYDTCNLLWSPSDAYISFLQTCDSSNLGSTRETYVVNRVTHAVEQATSFSPATTESPKNEWAFTGSYESVWTSPTMILTSGWFELIMGTVDKGVRTTTVQYDVASHVARTVDADWRNNFSLSGHGLIAYVKYIYPQAEAILEVSASIDSETLALFTGTRGCGAIWNANGMNFAYTLVGQYIDGNFCTGQSLQFVDLSDGAATATASFNIPENAFPIGWLS